MFTLKRLFPDFSILLLPIILGPAILSCSNDDNNQGDSPNDPNKPEGSVSIRIDADIDTRVFGTWFVFEGPFQDKASLEPIRDAKTKMSMTISRDAIVYKNEVSESGEVVCSVEVVTQNFSINKNSITFDLYQSASAQGEGEFSCSANIEKGSFGYTLVSEDEMTWTDTGSKEPLKVTRIKQ